MLAPAVAAPCGRLREKSALRGDRVSNNFTTPSPLAEQSRWEECGWELTVYTGAAWALGSRSEMFADAISGAKRKASFSTSRADDVARLSFSDVPLTRSHVPNANAPVHMSGYAHG